MDADAHVDGLVAVLVKVLDGGDHGQAHLHAVPRVVLLRLGATYKLDVTANFAICSIV